MRSFVTWRRNGVPLDVAGDTYGESRDNNHLVTNLEFLLNASDSHAVYSCEIHPYGTSDNFTIDPLSESIFCYACTLINGTCCVC